MRAQTDLSDRPLRAAQSRPGARRFLPPKGGETGASHIDRTGLPTTPKAGGDLGPDAPIGSPG